MNDLISRQAVISTIYDNESDFKNDFAQGFFADKIRDLPPVTPRSKTGHWEKHSYFKDAYICSSCNTGGNMVYKDFKYCPNCGAKMTEKSGEE